MQKEIMAGVERQIHPAEIRELFINLDPVTTWDKVHAIVHMINRDTDMSMVRDVFDDVMCLFDGSFPGYSPIQTPYHDLRHTLDVFMCTARLLHGVHISGAQLTSDDIALLLIAALLHDVGYAQRFEEASGSGAQFTQVHVPRGIMFMRQRLADWHLPAHWEASLSAIFNCTAPPHDLSQVQFPSAHVRLLGQIVGTADLIGQMADRCYLEKLLFLYVEFKEADIGGFHDMQDLFRRTRSFYEQIRSILDTEFDPVYLKLQYHFKASMGVERNFYMESVERNIEYLEQVMRLNESEWTSMLKRHGFALAYKQLNHQPSA